MGPKKRGAGKGGGSNASSKPPSRTSTSVPSAKAKGDDVALDDAGMAAVETPLFEFKDDESPNAGAFFYTNPNLSSSSFGSVSGVGGGVGNQLNLLDDIEADDTANSSILAAMATKKSTESRQKPPSKRSTLIDLLDATEATSPTQLPPSSQATAATAEASLLDLDFDAPVTSFPTPTPQNLVSASIDLSNPLFDESAWMQPRTEDLFTESVVPPPDKSSSGSASRPLSLHPTPVPAPASFNSHFASFESAFPIPAPESTILNAFTSVEYQKPQTLPKTITVSPTPAHGSLIDISPIESTPVLSAPSIAPAHASDSILNIAHKDGTLSISVSDLMAKLERLDKVQSMFNELEKNYKTVTKQYTKVNEILGKFTPLKDGVPVGDDAALNRLESFLNLKTSETSSLKEEVKSLSKTLRAERAENQTKTQLANTLQAKVKEQEEQIKQLKSAASPRRSVSFDTSTKPTIVTTSSHGAGSKASPSQATPPATSSFFNFQTLLPTSKPTSISTSQSTTAASPNTQDFTSPTGDSSSTSSAASTLQMKLKLRDLANALKKVTEQRDVAVSRIKELQDAQQQRLAPPSVVTHRRTSVDDLVVGPNSASSDASLVVVDLDVPLTGAQPRTSEDLLFGPLNPATESPSYGGLPTIQTPSRILEDHKTRTKDLEATVEMLRNEIFELTETNKKLRTSSSTAAIRRRVSSGGHFFDTAPTSTVTSNATPGTAADTPARGTTSSEVSDLEASLLEKTEELKATREALDTMRRSHEETKAAVQEARDALTACEADKVAVQEKLDAVDSAHSANLDSMAAVHDMTIKTLESERDNLKRLKALEVEKCAKLQAEVDALSKRRAELEERGEGLDTLSKSLTAANEAAVKSLQEEGLARKTATAEVEHLSGILVEREKELADAITARDTAESGAAAVTGLQAQLEAAQSAQKEAVSKMDKAYAVIRKLKADLDGKGKEIESLKAKIIELETGSEAGSNRTGTVKAELDTTRSALAESEAAVASLRVELEALKLTIQDLETQSTEARVQMAELATVKASHAESEAAIIVLTSEVETLRSKLTHFETISAEADSIRSQLDAAKLALLETETLVPKLQLEVESLKANMAELESRAAEAASLKGELEVIKTASAESEAVVSALKSEVDAFNSTLFDSETVKAELAATKATLGESEAAVASLKSEVEALKAAASGKTSDLASQVLSLTTKVAELTTLNATLESSVHEASKARELARSLVSELEAELRGAQGALESSKCTHENVDSLKSRAIELEQQLTAAAKLHSESSSKALAEHRETVQRLQSQLADAQDILASHETRVVDLVEEVKSARQTNESAKAQITELESKVLSLGDALNLATSKASDSEKLTASFAQREGVLVQERDRLKFRVDDMESRLAESFANVLPEPTNKTDHDNVESLQERIAELERQLENSSFNVPPSSENLESEMRIAELERQLAAAEDSHVSVTKNLQDRAIDLEAQLHSVTKSFAVASKVTDEADALRGQVAKLELELKESDDGLIEAHTAKEDLAKMVAALEMDLTSARNRLATSIVEKCDHPDYDSIKLRIDDLENRLVTVTDNHASSTRRVTELETELSATKDTLTEAFAQRCGHTDYDSLRASLVEVEAELKATKDSLSIALTEKCSHGDYDHIYSQLADKEEQFSKAKAELALALSKNCIHADYDVIVARLSELESELKLTRDAAQAKESDKGCKHEDVALLQTRIAELENELASSQKSLTESTTNIKGCNHEGIELLLEDKIRSLQTELAAAKIASSLSIDLNSVTTELNELREKLKSSEEAKAELESLLQKSTFTKPRDLSDPLGADEPDDVEYLTMKVTTLEAQILQLTSRTNSAEEALALAKQESHAHVEQLLSREGELSHTKAKLAEEEEKKNKSIQLLRNMKAKILKLEDTVTAKEAELTALKAELTEVRGNVLTGSAEQNAKVIMLTKQVDEMGARIRKQNDDYFQLEKQQEARNSEMEKLDSQLKEFKATYDSIVTERDELRTNEGLRSDEIEASRATLSLQSQQLTVWHERVKEVEFRLANLDDELETSKRLFESKSIEYETLQMKMSDLEKQFYETEQTVGTNSSEVDQLRREIMQLKREVGINVKDLREKETQLAVLKQEKEQFDSVLALSEKQSDVLRAELAQLTAKLNDLSMMEDQLKFASEQMVSLKASKESEVNKRTREIRIKLEESERVIDECKTRENQLLKLNKSLKDEVRKLARTIGIATPFTSPPLSQQNSGLDASEITAANTNLYKFPPRNNSQAGNTLGSGLDLGGSMNGLNWSQQGRSSPVMQNFPGSARNSLSLSSPISASGGPPGSSSSAAKLAANEEYLKNVVLRFVESKRDTKLQMIPALGMLLRLTPDEVKRIQKSV